MAFGSMNEGDDAPMADINVTPLVDVMLVLLIVFMITMPVMTHSVPLQLPTASEKQQQENQPQPKNPLRISINADGQYHLAEGEAISFKDLEARLLQIGKENPDAVIAIAADKNVPFERVE
ncbi:MAG: biopolymer transporter ExbD, partial [Eikenella sp.]|nr:biopolymer transporter ExbD [Eikenella sp.]